MTRWRIAVALVLLLTVGVPAGMPFVELLSSRQGWQAWAEGERLLGLADQTLRLVIGTLALAMPVGIAGAVLLYRTDLPLQGFLRLVTVLTLFVPLPLFASAWQAALGTGGWLPLGVWSTPPPGDPDLAPTGISWKPWAQGLGAAIWVHAVAALPWVVVLVGQGLRWVERELEEDALTLVGPWRVLWVVTLPRCRAAVCAAGLWVALLAATEITVTDLMQVRTFAEEANLQFVVGDRAGLARALAVAVPWVVLVGALVLAVARRWERNLPPLETHSAPPPVIPLGSARWPCLAAVLGTVGLLAGVPVASLVWKAGLSGSPPAWSAATVAGHLALVLRAEGGLVGKSLALAAAAGLLTAGLGLLLCWLALGARWFHAGVLTLMAVVWALPGPVVGIGLKETIRHLVDLSHSDTVAAALYYGPSPLPVLWADLVRFFPYAVAVLWPVVRLLPAELLDAARVDGVRPGQELRHIVLPLAFPACVRAGLAVAVLSLGELSAGKMVETPGSETFAHVVFTRMHYGVTNDLAALCLVLLGVVLVGGAVVAVVHARRPSQS
jgi:iron(III) transport system permease protein